MAPLQDRDVNLPLESTANTAGEKKPALNKTQSMEQTMHKKTTEPQSKQTGVYVSPSDAIQSPASQKLAGFKQRQINRLTNKKPAARTLFNKTASTATPDADLQDSEDVKQ